MLGIPTRTDAVAIAADYAEAVAAEALNEKLRGFENVFSTIFPHNHVAEAYRDTDSIELFSSIRRVWEITPEQVPAATAELLQPELVRDHYLAAIRAFRSVLEEARPALDRQTSCVVQTVPPRPYTGLSAGVGVQACMTDHVFEGNSLVRRKGKGRGWRYTFNPYKLATAMLDEFEKAVTSLCAPEQTKIEQITAMAKVANDTEEGANLSLAKAVMLLSGSSSPFGIERRKKHPVCRLVAENGKIGKASDLFLRFDETYFMVRLKPDEDDWVMQIPAECVFDTVRRMTGYALSHRMLLRRVINQVLADRACVTINGVAYERAVVGCDGAACEGYRANGQTCQELVNLFGRPVQQPDGTLMSPEAWAQEEVELVEAFLDRRDAQAIKTLLERYDLDTAYGNSTREKAIGQLEYSCSPPFV